jgi:chromosomal replication initiation ATPase DnaA
MDETAPAGRRIATYAEAFVKAASRNKRDRGTWLTISGPAGVGKSHALRRCHRFLAAHAVDLWDAGLWRAVPDAMLATWSRVVDLPRTEWDDWLFDLRRASFVCLDDVGSEVDRYRSGEPVERLRIALEICEPKWLMVTTNATPAQLKTVWDARVASRLSRAAVLDLTGCTDYRPRLKASN